MVDTRPLTREELGAFLPNKRAIIAFENLFRSVPTSVIDIEINSSVETS